MDGNDNPKSVLRTLEVYYPQIKSNKPLQASSLLFSPILNIGGKSWNGDLFSCFHPLEVDLFERNLPTLRKISQNTGFLWPI